MVVKKKTNLYDDVVVITSDYLGPAAQRFIDRQIQSHFDKEPEKLTSKDIDKLAEWSRASMSLITDRQSVIQEFYERLMLLPNNRKYKTG